MALKKEAYQATRSDTMDDTCAAAGCYCRHLLLHKAASVSAWTDFRAISISTCDGSPTKEASGPKGKKQWGATRSRYGYETLDDKYKFSHYKDTSKYIEEYRNMFSVASRTHAKTWKPAGAYNFIRMTPQTRVTSRLGREYRDTRRMADQDIPDDINTEATAQPSNTKDMETKSDKKVEKGKDIMDTKLTLTVEPQTTGNTRRPPPSHTKLHSQMGVAPPLGDTFGSVIDKSKDSIYDECEDDVGQTTPKVPLLKQLNTFFLSKHGRRRTSRSSVNSGNLFPHIHSSCEHTSQDLGEMTAASIINYRVPSAQKRPTSHPRLAIEKSVENQQTMFRPIIQRQKTQMFPMRMKAIATSNLTHYDNIHSAMQTSNYKRFNALSLRQSTPMDRSLPKTHILTAKNMHRSVRERKDVDDTHNTREVEATATECQTKFASNAGTLRDRPRTDPNKSLHNILLGYGAKSLHPYLTPSADVYEPADSNFGKAELVDYGPMLTSHYRD